MGLIVQKFGGSSLADAQRIRHVARIITDTYDKGHSVVAVVSAQGGTTDELIAKAAEINPVASQREMDMLLSTGEQASCALCAMAVEVLQHPVISLTGLQAGIRSDAGHGNAQIQTVDTTRLLSELDQGKIVIVAGFQGETPQGDISTLGRGGSDTSAVALAAALNAERCQIYTDVDGIYTTDPRLVPQATQLEEITYDEMLELAHHGAKVLHDRSVALAQEKQVPLEVLSSFSGKPGTMVKATLNTSRSGAAGITQEKAALFTLKGSNPIKGFLSHIFDLLRGQGIDVDLTLQAEEKGPVLLLGVKETDRNATAELLTAHLEAFGFDTVEEQPPMLRISIVGEGFCQDANVGKRLEQLLRTAGINADMLFFTPRRVSLFVSPPNGDALLSLLHQTLFESAQGGL